MIVVIEQYNAHEYSHLMDQMFQMRARVFHDRYDGMLGLLKGGSVTSMTTRTCIPDIHRR